MKTECQVKAKLKQHEDLINAHLEMNRDDWTPDIVANIETYLNGRKALLWVLSDKDLIDRDEFDNKIRFELACCYYGPNTF